MRARGEARPSIGVWLVAGTALTLLQTRGTPTSVRALSPPRVSPRPAGRHPGVALRPPGTGTALRCLVSREPRAQPWADARSEGGGRGLRAPGPGPRAPVCVADEARPGAPARARLHVQACVCRDGRAARGQCPSRGSPVPSSTGRGSGPLRLGRWPRPPGHASPPIPAALPRTPGHLRGCAPTSEGPGFGKPSLSRAWVSGRGKNPGLPGGEGGRMCKLDRAVPQLPTNTRPTARRGPGQQGLGSSSDGVSGQGPPWLAVEAARPWGQAPLKWPRRGRWAPPAKPSRAARTPTLNAVLLSPPAPAPPPTRSCRSTCRSESPATRRPRSSSRGRWSTPGTSRRTWASPGST